MNRIRPSPFLFLFAKPESSQGFIRVQAPQFRKVSMVLQLTEDLQAADVLTRFLSQDRSWLRFTFNLTWAPKPPTTTLLTATYFLCACIALWKWSERTCVSMRLVETSVSPTTVVLAFKCGWSSSIHLNRQYTPIFFHQSIFSILFLPSNEIVCLYCPSLEERCLDGEAFMKDLFQVNPAAEWIIKAGQWKGSTPPKFFNQLSATRTVPPPKPFKPLEVFGLSACIWLKKKKTLGLYPVKCSYLKQICNH